MINPKSQSELDQALATILEFHPPLWFKMYKRLMEEGFTEPQALKLTQTYIIGMCRSAGDVSDGP